MERYRIKNIAWEYKTGEPVIATEFIAGNTLEETLEYFILFYTPEENKTALLSIPHINTTIPVLKSYWRQQPQHLPSRKIQTRKKYTIDTCVSSIQNYIGDPTSLTIE